MRLKDKVALITGAASGIGRASAIMFAREGAKIVVSDIDDAGSEETVNRIRSASGEAVYVHADVSLAVDVDAMIQATIQAFGRIDILFNNAGYYRRPYNLEDTTEEEWDRTYAVNVKGVFGGKICRS